MESYVYVYLNPLKKGKFIYNDIKFEYEPFYIGQGSGKRYLSHLNENIENFPNKHKINTISKIKDAGKEPIIKFLYENISYEESIELEIELIKIIGRSDLKTGPLTNLTIGGEGVVGCKRSEETRKKMSEAQMGKIPWNKGKTGLFEGKKNPMFGRKHKKSTKLKISDANSGNSNGLRKKVLENPEIIKGKNNHLSKSYEITTPNGEKIEIKGLRNYCEKNNLHHSNMIKVANGKQKSHKGYKCKRL